MIERAIAKVPSSSAAAGEDLRSLFQRRVEEGRTHEAIQAARCLLEEQPGRHTHRFLRGIVESSAVSRIELKRLKVAMLSSFSIEFVEDSLIALGLLAGMEIQIYRAAFGTFRQELLDPRSDLYNRSPDVVVIAVEGADWIDAAYGAFSVTPDLNVDQIASEFAAEVRGLIMSFRGRSPAPLIIHNFALPSWRKFGILDAKVLHGQGQVIGQLNIALSSVAREAVDVHVLDYAALVNRHGAINWYDDRMNLYAKSPIANAMQPYLSGEYVKHFAALTGRSKKCLVLDLDNTLWGGVVGEDGVDGIQLGPNYPGSAYLEFQRHVLDLRARGVILALASKNSRADVTEVFARHPFMLLKEEHFANVQIHWEAKSTSLLRIAEELAIGLEHIVFVDDSPIECAEVRRALPAAHVIQLPSRPEHYVRSLQEAGLFDTLVVSAEDRQRADLYQQRALAETSRRSAPSIEEFYRELNMEIAIGAIDQTSLSRAAQLTQKTNQFNVTTLRYSEAQIAERMRDARWFAATVRVKDKFGDNGIVGVIMAKQDDDVLELDTLLLSCRVIGRTVETAMLADLCELGRNRGARRLSGMIVPTSKNAPAQDLFERHGFTKICGDETTTTTWQLDLAGECVPWPSWFKRIS